VVRGSLGRVSLAVVVAAVVIISAVAGFLAYYVGSRKVVVTFTTPKLTTTSLPKTSATTPTPTLTTTVTTKTLVITTTTATTTELVTTTTTTSKSVTTSTVTTSPPTPTRTTTVSKSVSTTSRATTSAPSKGIVLTILTRHPGDIQIMAQKYFLQSKLAKEYHIVGLRFIQEPPGWWVVMLKRGVGVDVAWGGGPTLFDMLYQNHLLAPLTGGLVEDAVKQIPDTLAGAPMKRVGPDGKVYWVAAAISSFGFTVNHDKLKLFGLPTPKTWTDLGSPTFGKPLLEFGVPAVGIADPTQSTSNTRMYEIILQRYGWDEGWVVLTTMAANAQIYSHSGDVRDAVIRGDIAVGITIDFYGYTAQKQNPACEYIIPKGATIVNGDPIALLVTSKHPEAAKAFIAWVLTEGQKIWLSPTINRLPANPRIFSTPEGEKRPDLKKAFESALHTKAMKFNDTLALLYENAMRYYFKAVLVDSNGELKQVWLALLKKYFNHEIDNATFWKYVKELGKPLTYVDPVTGKKVTFTQSDAIRVNKIISKNPALLSKYMLAWKQAASKRYHEILKELGG